MLAVSLLCCSYIAVDNFADLVKMARNMYMCRVVDVLEMSLT